jgi:predicted GIY-YIG superfamily endonuclease
VSEPAECPALYRLYTTKQSDGLPAALDDLYPWYMEARRYLGTAGSCRNGGAGIFYRPFDYESENCVGLERVVRWGKPQKPVPTALYRLWGGDGALLYIGITSNPEVRWTNHESDKPWWPLVKDRSLRWFPNRDRALEAEARAIRAEHPVHNYQHNQKPSSTPAAQSRDQAGDAR